jgi:hypothetical protein
MTLYPRKHGKPPDIADQRPQRSIYFTHIVHLLHGILSDLFVQVTRLRCYSCGLRVKKSANYANFRE